MRGSVLRRSHPWASSLSSLGLALEWGPGSRTLWLYLTSLQSPESLSRTFVSIIIFFLLLLFYLCRCSASVTMWFEPDEICADALLNYMAIHLKVVRLCVTASVMWRPLNRTTPICLIGLLGILFCNICHGFLEVKISREVEEIAQQPLLSGKPPSLRQCPRLVLKGRTCL